MGLGTSKPKVLPFPSGPYSVGCADLMTDFSEDVGVFIRFYYPVEHCDISHRTVQFPQWIPRIDYIDGYADFIGWPHERFRFLFNWKVGKVLIPCLWHAPVLAPRHEKFPVLIFSHGLGAMRTTYSTFCCDIASHGYVVAAMEHRDRSACWTYFVEQIKEIPADNEYPILEEKPLTHQKLQPGEKEFKLRNRQMYRRVNECVKALHLLEEINMGLHNGSHTLQRNNNASRIFMDDGFDWSQFNGRLDLSKVIISGHSFGGATALAASATCSEFRAALVLDGWMFPLENDIYPKVVQPTFFVNTDYFQWKDNIARMNRFKKQGKNMVTIKDSVHQSQTDFTYLMKGWVARKLQTKGPIDALLCNEVNNRVSLAFLDYQLGLSNMNRLPSLLLEYKDCLIDGTNINTEEKPNL